MQTQIAISEKDTQEHTKKQSEKRPFFMFLSYLCRFVLRLKPLSKCSCSLYITNERQCNQCSHVNREWHYSIAPKHWKLLKHSQQWTQHHSHFHSQKQNPLAKTLLLTLLVLEKVVGVEKHKPLSICTPQPHVQPPCWTKKTNFHKL
jgi:hypothetical protein